MTPRLIPLDRAAVTLGVPLAWLRREVDRGTIPVVHAGRRIVCDVDAVAAVLAERARERADAKGGTDAAH